MLILVTASASAALAAACSVSEGNAAAVRTDPRGRAVIMAPRCADEAIAAVQVSDAAGAAVWRVEGGGNEFPSIFVVGREPPLMRETTPLTEPLDPSGRYVATVEFDDARPDVDVVFATEDLSIDRVVDEDGNSRSQREFFDEADLECVGDFIWVAGAIGLVFVLAVVAGIVAGFWVIVKVLRKAKRQREQEATPARPDLSGR